MRWNEPARLDAEGALEAGGDRRQHGAATAATHGRTHPLCLYGTYSKYIGAASPSQAQVNDAANFTCAPF